MDLNSYFWILTRVFILSTRAFKLSTRNSHLVTLNSYFTTSLFIDALYWKIFPIYFKITGYLKERGFDEEVLRKVRESQVSYFVSLYNVTISLSILDLLNNSMNRSMSSGEDRRACDFSDEKSFIEGAIWHLNFYCFI